MNVLVYNGAGASVECVQHTVETLRSILEPNYAVNTISNKALLTEPWMTKTSALVFPGGADLPYVKDCKPIVPEIKKFVNNKGGLFIGFCAGGYYGSSRCEFYQGHPDMEVTGPRDLKLYPGIARGPTYPGFKYKSHENVKVAMLNVDDGTRIPTYYHGGGSFISPESYDNVEVLARYEDKETMFVKTYNDEEKSCDAAVVLVKNGKGNALLFGSHPEYVPELLKNNSEDVPYEQSIIDELSAGNLERLSFMRYVLSRAGLKINENKQSKKLALTPFYLSVDPNKQSLITEIEDNLKTNRVDDDSYYLESNADKFKILKGFNNNKLDETKFNSYDDPSTVTKLILLPNKNESIVTPQKTSKFNVEKYFKHRASSTNFGSMLLYGEVVTSTSTLLDSNKSLLSVFPKDSLVFVGTTQIAGKGRGGNVWVSPEGLLASTLSISLPISSPTTGNRVSIVFVQYLAALALTKAIKTYAKGYENVPVKIKWPNDLYIMNPEYYKNKNLDIFNLKPVPLNDMEPSYVKSAGILINTNFLHGDYNVLVGTGFNATNSAPSVSLQMWVDIINEELKNRGLDKEKMLPPVEHEKLLALYVNYMDDMCSKFLVTGARSFLPEYYSNWMHTSQIIQLTEHNCRAKITGITEDYGLLIAKELVYGSDDMFTGTTFNLQPDGNTFDIFRGLISKKVYN